MLLIVFWKFYADFKSEKHCKKMKIELVRAGKLNKNITWIVNIDAVRKKKRIKMMTGKKLTLCN